MNELLNDPISLWQLLCKKTVVIPIIQRDYAQGRRNSERAKKVRRDFLNSIEKAIGDDGTPLFLDFVFGAQNGERVELIDGQQRMTTLFLLYVYFAIKEKKLNGAKKILDKFTYETRTYTKEFCKKLCWLDTDQFELMYSEQPDGKTIEENRFEETIRNMHWFRDTWKNDPTVDAMLSMLGEIDNKFSTIGKDDVFECLKGENKAAPIQFLFQGVENFGESEDLYIKMNSRGKQLTDYESFKAQFGGHLKELEKEDESLKQFTTQYWKNIDGPTSNAFWDLIESNYRRKGIGVDKWVYKTDEAMMSYIWIQVEMYYSLANKDVKKPKKPEDNDIPEFYAKRTPLVDFDLINGETDNWKQNSNIISPEKMVVLSLVYATRIFELLTEFFDETSNDYFIQRFGDTESIFAQFVPTIEKNDDGIPNISWSGKSDYLSRIMVFSVIFWYCKYKNGESINDDEKKRLCDYLRLIRNIIQCCRTKKSGKRVWDPEFGKYECGTMISFIVNQLFEKEELDDCAIRCSELKGLNSSNSKIENAIEQEIRICNQQDYIKEYRYLEDHKLFQGNILPIVGDKKPVLSYQEVIELFPEGNSVENQYVLLAKTLLAEGEDDRYSCFCIPSGQKNNNSCRVAFCDTDVNDAWSLALLYDVSEYNNKNIKVLKKVLEEKRKGNTLESIVEHYLAKEDEKKKYSWRYYFVKYGKLLFGEAEMIFSDSKNKSRISMPTIDISSENFFSWDAYFKNKMTADSTINALLYIAAKKLMMENSLIMFEAGSTCRFYYNGGYIDCSYHDGEFLVGDLHLRPTEELEVIELITTTIKRKLGI